MASHNTCLRDDLITVQPIRPAGAQAAHIIPTADFIKRSPNVQKAIQTAKSKYDEFIGADPRNTAINGFWSDVRTGHAGTHTDKFFIALGDASKDVNSRDEALKALDAIEVRIKAGEFIKKPGVNPWRTQYTSLKLLPTTRGLKGSP